MSVPVCPYQVIYLLCVIPRMDIFYWTVDMSIIYLVSLVILLFTALFPLQENFLWHSLQCRRILGGRNLVRVRNVVVAAMFDFMTVEDWVE